MNKIETRTTYGETPARPQVTDVPTLKTLTMVIINGLFIVGHMGADGRLRCPRVLSILEQGARIQLAPLPGIPGHMHVGVENPFYPIPLREKAIYDLYTQVTAKGVDPNID